MKKVVLLGDSIRLIGYGLKVPELLGNGYEVYQPEDNCGFVKKTLRMLFDIREKLDGCDVIHWNNGLWDVFRPFDDGKTLTSEEEYLENMIRVAEILKKVTPNVIFATTTPVRENRYYSNADIDRYNAFIVPKLQKIGLKINDLNGLLKNDIEKYIRSDDLLHLTEEGINVCARQVADCIKNII